MHINSLPPAAALLLLSLLLLLLLRARARFSVSSASASFLVSQCRSGLGMSRLFSFVRAYSTKPPSPLHAIMKDMSLDFARSIPMSRIVPPPRTGVYAGRSVAVARPTDLPRAVAQLGQINRLNRVREVKNLQRFHEQPGKAKWRIRMARKRRDFRAGMKTLFHLALQAQKRGL